MDDGQSSPYRIREGLPTIRPQFVEREAQKPGVRLHADYSRITGHPSVIPQGKVADNVRSNYLESDAVVLGDWGSSSVLNALMTDDVEPFILCWRLKIMH